MVLHKISKPKQLSKKAINRSRKKYLVGKAANKLEETYHAHQRLEERFSYIDNNKVKIDMIYWILSWTIKYNEWLKTYKVCGKKWVYILWLDYKIVTVMNENTWSTTDKYYIGLDKEKRKELMIELGILFE